MGRIPGIVLLGGALLALATVALWRGRPKRPRRDGGYVTGLDVGTEKPANFVVRWLTTVDHRDIGVLYLLLGTVAALWGGVDGMMIRTELLTPTTTVWDVETYNALFTTHGLTMLLFFVTPVFTGIANYFLPILIGADDMAFPRINAIAFWLLPPSLALVRGGLITEVLGKGLEFVGVSVPILLDMRPVEMGWTMYTPMTAEMANPQIDVTLLGLHLSGIATTIAAINVIVTVFCERDEDVGWANLDIFSWGMLTTSAIVLFAFPVLGSALVMLLLDRNFGTSFFAVEGGGPELWQHLFWFFGHPEVYILVLPAFSLISYVLPKLVGRHLFGFRFVVYSTLAIGVLSFGVWAHHMFVLGMHPQLRAAFMVTSLSIAVPSAVKTFNWIATMWYGRLRLSAPFLFCAAGVGIFAIGGVTGVFTAVIPYDMRVHDTLYVVGHFHLIIMAIIPFSMFAASYFWFPLLTGRLYDRRLARAQALTMIPGVLLTFLPMLVMGNDGMPRRYAEYPEIYHPHQIVASIGALLIGVSVVLWLINMIQSYRIGIPVRDADVWDLKETNQFSREWRWFERRLAKQGGAAVGEAPEPEAETRQAEAMVEDWDEDDESDQSGGDASDAGDDHADDDHDAGDDHADDPANRGGADEGQGE
ncbi:cytochrome-c oxidase [Halostella sp. JP-L12]|uniref:cytochrome c oxidase subunit I n=1 Tax=Halostella TaxID=1843185 RepID=UPI000EF77FF7|nr:MULTISPECIES: cbb3-type cytochrome c oxidase subunit I [Halostella]NHN47085.1 cytochrome-c oxidase [Halostella sp. JP-L12]